MTYVFGANADHWPLYTCWSSLGGVSAVYRSSEASTLYPTPCIDETDCARQAEGILAVSWQGGGVVATGAGDCGVAPRNPQKSVSATASAYSYFHRRTSVIEKGLVAVDFALKIILVIVICLAVTSTVGLIVGKIFGTEVGFVASGALGILMTGAAVQAAQAGFPGDFGW